MAYGDLILYRPARRNVFGRLIAYFTGGPFSHVSISTDLLGHDAINLGAHPKGGIHTTLTTTEGGEKLVVPLPAGANRFVGLLWAYAHLGKPYGLLDLLSNVFKLLGCRWYIAARDSMDCSEYAARYLQECGVNLPDELDEALPLVSPNDLARFLGVL